MVNLDSLDELVVKIENNAAPVKDNIFGERLYDTNIDHYLGSVAPMVAEADGLVQELEEKGFNVEEYKKRLDEFKKTELRKYLDNVKFILTVGYGDRVDTLCAAYSACKDYGLVKHLHSLEDYPRYEDMIKQLWEDMYYVLPEKEKIMVKAYMKDIKPVYADKLPK